MKTETIDLTLPVALNTYHDVGQLLPTEAVINKNVIRLPSGELSTHPRWLSVQVTGSTRLWTYFLVDNAFIERQFLVFGHYASGGQTRGFVGRILAEDIVAPSITVEKLIDDLNPCVVPCFVPYYRGIYILLGAYGIKYYDGATVKAPGGDLANTYAAVGLAIRDRMWVAGLFNDPGVAKYTEFNSESIPVLNTVPCGDQGEMITAMMGKDESILLFKENEFYEYAWGDDITAGTLRVRSYKAGCTYHTLLQKKFDTVYATNKKGCFIINPKYVRASGREVVVEPDVVDVGLSIRNVLDDFKTLNFTAKLYVYDLFNWNDFVSHTSLVIMDENERIRLMQSGVWNMAQAVEDLSSQYINATKTMGQSWKPTEKCFGHEMMVRVARGTEESTPKLRVSIFDDNSNAPGDELFGKDLDTSGWELGVYAWRSLDIRTEAEDFEFEAGVRYWIILADAGTEVEEDKYGWRVGSDTYANGNFWRSDTGHDTNKDAMFKFWAYKYVPWGQCVSKDVTLSGISYWGVFDATEIKPDNTNIEYWLSGDGGSTWHSVTSGNVVPDVLKYAESLRWKAKLSTTDNCATPLLDKIKIAGVVLGEGEVFVSGFREDRYYLAGKDASSADLYLVYAPDGWLNLEKYLETVKFSQCQEVIEMNGYRIVGVGTAGDVPVGALFYEVDPDHAQYLEMPVHLKTGQMLLDEVPKKGRRIFITYKGIGVVLKVHTVGGTKTFNLPDATSFKTKELNFGTERTRYFELELTATKNYKQKKLSADIKFFKRNE